ncbi:hypothetical protein G6F57_019992 [Rhizopus arrhizus]|nr:hypothetical protein G6F57_019992 [Rhizopus arrhizus]
MGVERRTVFQMPHPVGGHGGFALRGRMPFVPAAQRQNAVLAQRVGRRHEFQIHAVGAGRAVGLVGEEHGACVLHILHHAHPQRLRDGQRLRERSQVQLMPVVTLDAQHETVTDQAGGRELHRPLDPVDLPALEYGQQAIRPDPGRRSASP